MSDEGYTRIGISDADFMVATTIERCPRTMMLRELVTNAFEAAATAPPGRRVVEVRPVAVPGLPGRKLSIWNTGRGMDADELEAMCSLASSGKAKGIDANFGIGAKVASLPSNPFGLRYRSCRDGAVSQVVMGKWRGVYCILHQACEDADGAPTESPVIDVTEALVEEGVDVSEDWTEVTLCGASADQDTVSDPYGGEIEVNGQWIPTYLTERYFAIPEGLELVLADGTHTRHGARRVFRPYLDRLRAVPGGRVEAVADPSGIVVHYGFVPPNAEGRPSSINGSVTSARLGGALVHKGELYDVRNPRKWAAEAPAFGINFGAKLFTILVELPDDGSVAPDQYRTFLSRRRGDQAPVRLEDFHDDAQRLMPQWMRDEVARLQPPEESDDGDLKDMMRRMLRDRGVTADGARDRSGDVAGLPPPPPPAPPRPVREEAAGAPKASPLDLDLFGTPRQRAERRPPLLRGPAGARAAGGSPVPRDAPQLIFIEDKAEVLEKGIAGKAALYVPNRNVLFINRGYVAYEDMRRAIAAKYDAGVDPQVLDGIARKIARETVDAKICRALIIALTKRDAVGWNREDAAKAISPEALSVAADSWEDRMGEVGRVVGRRTGRGKRAGARDEDASEAA